jgi:hypothetical protein
MSRLSGFNSPLLLGFDHFERILDQASKASAEGYPPNNAANMNFASPSPLPVFPWMT